MRNLLPILLILGPAMVAMAADAKSLILPAGPCGQEKDAPPVVAWAAQAGRCPGEAVSGPGVSLIEPAKPGFASRSFTFETWVRWPEEAAGKYKPEIIAEAHGEKWTWAIGYNETGVLYVNWGPGTQQHQLEGWIMYDVMYPGKWYHIAVVFDSPDGGGTPTVRAYVTQEGRSRPFCHAWGTLGAVPAMGEGEQIRLAVGRGVFDDPTGPMRVGSAAFYDCARPADSLAADTAPDAVPTDIIGRLPQGVSIDNEIEIGSLGVYGMRSDGVILFSNAPRHMRNYWYAFRVRGAKGKTLTFQTTEPEPMMLSPWIAEGGLSDIAGPYGGKGWTKPNGYVQRRMNVPRGESTHLSFSHTFASDDALVSGCPMITTTMADAWLDEVAVKKLGAKLRIIGHTPDGKPLRVAEIGNPDAPLVWWQNGQHSAVERFGYHLAVTAFEHAARDPELLQKTRWFILPVVNIDSYMVMPKIGDRNLNRVWAADQNHPTISAIRKFLETETARTGTLAAFDLHAGTVQRGNTLASGGSVNGVFEKFLTETGFVPVTTRARPWTGPVPPAPADTTDWHPGATSRSFGAVGSALPGARASYTLELSTMAARSPRGAGPISPQIMSNDGVAFYKALKKLIDAPMPAAVEPAPGRRSPGPTPPAPRAGG